MSIELKKKVADILANATDEEKQDIFGSLKEKVWSEVAPTMPESSDREISGVVMNMIQQGVVAHMSKPIDVSKAIHA